MMTFLIRFAGIVLGVLMMSGCATQLEKNTPAYKANAEKIYSEKSDANRLYQLGREYQAKEQYAEAIEAYGNALELKADHYDAYNGLGVVYSMLGEHELAIQMINEAVKLAPLASYLHNNLGYAYLKHGLASEAAGAFQRAIQLDPDNANARQNLLKAYEVMGCVEGRPCGQWQEPGYR